MRSTSFLTATALLAVFNALLALSAPSLNADAAWQLRVAARRQQDLDLARRGTTHDAKAFASKSYDYIVVGGGTAGLAVAARLSESGKYSVGVLEAGIDGYGDPLNDIPGEHRENEQSANEPMGRSERRSID
jgi:hypothetical protein